MDIIQIVEIIISAFIIIEFQKVTVELLKTILDLNNCPFMTLESKHGEQFKTLWSIFKSSFNLKNIKAGTIM